MGLYAHVNIEGAVNQASMMTNMAMANAGSVIGMMVGAIGGALLAEQKKQEQENEKENAEQEEDEDELEAFEVSFEEAPQIDLSLAMQAFIDTFKSIIDGQCPVDTGYLKSTCDAVATGPFSADCRAGAEYAEYVEYGTCHMGAQPYFEPAIQGAVEAALATARSELEQQLDQIAEACIETAVTCVASLSIAGIILLFLLAIIIEFIAAIIHEIFSALFDAVYEGVAEAFMDGLVIYTM